MGSLEANDIKALFFFNRGTLQMEISHFHGYFCSFMDFFFFLFQDLSREKCPISCTQETWKVCTFAGDL